MNTQPIFQQEVFQWLEECFGPQVSNSKHYRCKCLLEEALELVQAGGFSLEHAHTMVDYVYDRAVGDLPQEIGGVMVTLAAFCEVFGYDMAQEGCTELKRIWGKMGSIRAKQKLKPKLTENEG
jgi:hypothetical protein